MAIIGIDDETGSGERSMGVADYQYLCIDDPDIATYKSITYTPIHDGEEVYEFGIHNRTGSSVNVDLAVYDVTNGDTDSDLVISQSITGSGVAGWDTVEVAGENRVILTKGQTYALALKWPQASWAMSMFLDFSSPGREDLALYGDDPFADPWTSQTSSIYLWCAYAKTRIKCATRLEVQEFAGGV